MTPMPLCVITGFLGAGKTTLLNRLLSDPLCATALVVINEFGEVGLDHLFVEAPAADLMVLASGCLCCTVRGDLVDALADVLARRDAGTIRAFDRVIIETTGLADPVTVLNTILYEAVLAQRLRLDAVVTLVDAVNGMATLDAHVEAVRQVAVADRLVLSKTDLAPDVSALRARLGALNPGATILDATQADAAALLGAGLFGLDGKAADVARWLDADAFAAQGGPHHHRHDVNRHDARIRAFCLRADTPIDPATFDLFVELLRSTHGAHLLRVKGLIALSDEPHRPMVIHGAQHVFHPAIRLPRWPDADRGSRLVVIGDDLPLGYVEKLWDAFTAPVRIDTPDADAYTSSPLAPRGGGLFG